MIPLVIIRITKQIDQITLNGYKYIKLLLAILLLKLKIISYHFWLLEQKKYKGETKEKLHKDTP